MNVPATILLPGTIVVVGLPFEGQNPEALGFLPVWDMYGTVMATGTDTVLVEVTEDDYSNGDNAFTTATHAVAFDAITVVCDHNGATVWDATDVAA